MSLLRKTTFNRRDKEFATICEGYNLRPTAFVIVVTALPRAIRVEMKYSNVDADVMEGVG